MYLRAHPECEIKNICGGRIPNNLATEVDHRTRIAERPDLRLVWSNLQACCKSCHSAKTANENMRG